MRGVLKKGLTLVTDIVFFVNSCQNIGYIDMLMLNVIAVKF